MDRRNFLKSALFTSALYAGSPLWLPSRQAYAMGFPSGTDPIVVNIMLLGGPDWRHILPPAFSDIINSVGHQYWLNNISAHGITDTIASMQARWDNDYFHVSDNAKQFGISKKCAWLHDMWQADNVALVSNAFGVTSRNHDHGQRAMDQGRFLTDVAAFEASGWGGRLAAADNANVLALTRSPRRFCYGPHPTDPSNHVNDNLIPLQNSREASLFTDSTTPSQATLEQVMRRSLEHYYRARGQSIPDDDAFARFFELEQTIREFGEPIENRLSTIPEPDAIKNLYLSGSEQRLNTPYLGEQIRNLHDALACADILNMRTASLELGGFDTHINQKERLEANMQDLFGENQSLDVLYQNLPENIKDRLVFVISGEFGRQIKSNGAFGTDHGEGTTIMVLGRPVNGGLYGNPFPEAELARYGDNTPQIKGETSIERIYAEVSEWAAPGSSNSVVPNANSQPLEAGTSLNDLFS